MKMIRPVECPDSLDILTWSRLRREITCARTALVVQTQEVNPITIAMVMTPRLFLPDAVRNQDQQHKGGDHGKDIGDEHNEVIHHAADITPPATP